MKLDGNTILITGGATGIGLALAQRFVAAGSQVIVCGRRAEALAEARAQCPGLATEVCDLAQANERERLYATIAAKYPTLNVLINNAGIQRRGRLSEDATDWAARQQEIAINFEAPVHLSSLFLPQLRQQPGAAIVNVSSGLAFTPAAPVAVYAATKAALHSFTVSLRYSLASSGIKVYEIVPPAVNTDLGGKGLHLFGEPVDAFADAMMAGLAADQLEIGYGTAEKARRASREELDAFTERMNANWQ